MSASEFLHQPVAQALGWALLHFVWQGALVGALTALTLAVLRRSAADVRYVVATIALSVVATMPIVTAVQVWRGEPSGTVQAVPSAGLQSRAVSAGGSASAGVEGAPVPRIPTALSARPFDVEAWLPVFVAVWLCGVLALTLRLASGWLWVQRMKTHSAGPAGDALDAIAATLSRACTFAAPCGCSNRRWWTCRR